MKLGGIRCCSCCSAIFGFERAAWSGITSCCSGASPFTNLKDDLTHLTECQVVFAGHIPGTCTNAIYFTSGDWPTVADYISNGGRLWLNLEFSGCLADATNSNAFIAAMGSGMTYGATIEGGDTCTAGDANIAQGLAAGDFKTGTSSKINGGTSVWLNTTASNPVVCVEQIGDGFLFVCGDSEALTNGGYATCNFIKRIWEYSDEEII